MYEVDDEYKILNYVKINIEKKLFDFSFKKIKCKECILFNKEFGCVISSRCDIKEE